MSENFPAELGAVYESGFSWNDVDAEKLASELNLEEYQFSNEQYQNTNKVILTLINDILPHIKWLNKEQIGDYLVEHIDDIFRICNVFPESHRLPLLITKQSLTLYEPLFTAELQMGIEEFYHALFCCIHFYLYLRGVKWISSLYSRHKQFHSHVHNIIQDECSSELMATWWWRSKYFFRKMVSDEKSSQLLKELLVGSSYRIEKSLIPEYRKLKIDYWFQENLPPERILIDLPEFLGRELSPLEQEKITQLDIPALNFFLCQTHILWYEEVVGWVLKKPDYYPVWSAWVAKYIQHIKKEWSQSNIVFCGIFDIKKKKIFQPERWKLSKEVKAKIPPVIQLALLEAEQALKKRNHTVEQVKTKVSRIYMMSSVLSVRNEKERIEMPSTNSLFVWWAEGQQQESISFPEKYLPAWTTVTLERTIGGKKDQTFPLAHEGVTDIPAVENLQKDLHFSYVVRIKLPKTHIFTNGESDITLLPYKIYVKVPKKFETVSPVVRIREEKKAASVIAPTVQTKVTSVLEKLAKTLSDTVTAWEWALEEKLYTFELREDWAVLFHMNSDLTDELHDTSFGILQIAPDSSVSPGIQKNEILTQLQDIARELREKREEAQKLALQAEQEEKEYQTLREQFQPFCDFIGEQTFVDKNNKELFDKASDDFKNSLKSLNWSMPWRITKDGQIQFRHTRNKLKITYSNLGALINVAGEGRTLSRAEERCYTEIAEAFSHLALFYTAEYRERQKMISKEKKFQKDTLKEVEAYEALLDEGKGRIVRYSSGEKGRIYVSKFPLDDKPQMIAEKVGHDTVEKALQEYEHSELCYRRDIVRINGEIGEDAGEQSLENTHQNLFDLRQSPRARFILRKRILITLDYEKFSGDDRRPIQPEKDWKKKTSAFEILHSLKNAKNIESKEQIDEEFMDSYIDLLIQHKIRIQYVWPLSVSLADHRKQLEKIRKQKKPTAG